MKKLILLLLPSLLFASQKISQLPLESAANVGNNDSFPFVSVSGDATERLKISDLLSVPALSSILSADLAAKVGITGNETIAGVKTFSSAPVINAGIQIKKISTPSPVLSGADFLYTKSNDKLYLNTYTGTESLIGPQPTVYVGKYCNSNTSGAFTSSTTINFSTMVHEVGGTLVTTGSSWHLTVPSPNGAGVWQFCPKVTLASVPLASNNYAYTYGLVGSVETDIIDQQYGSETQTQDILLGNCSTYSMADGSNFRVNVQKRSSDSVSAASSEGTCITYQRISAQ